MSTRDPEDWLRKQAASMRESAKSYLAKADESRQSAEEYDHWHREALDAADAYDKAADVLEEAAK